MNVIFLDIDGVLHPSYGEGLDALDNNILLEKQLYHLKEIFMSVNPLPEIVLTSNWRKNEFLKDFSNVENLKDYTDNTIRYFRLTRLIYIRGGGYYIDLEPRRMVEIEALLNTYDGSAEEF